MSIYIIPALFALMIKLGVLTLSTKGVSKSPLFFTMVLFFACHNVAEVLGILEFFNGDFVQKVMEDFFIWAGHKFIFEYTLTFMSPEGNKEQVRLHFAWST